MERPKQYGLDRESDPEFRRGQCQREDWDRDQYRAGADGYSHAGRCDRACESGGSRRPTSSAAPADTNATTATIATAGSAAAELHVWGFTDTNLS